MNINFKGKTVFITGCTEGIGKEILDNFYNLGANCIGLGRNEKKLKKLEDQYKDKVKTICFDLSNSSNLLNELKKFEIPSNWAYPSIIINNVGGGQVFHELKLIPETAISEFNKQVLSFNQILNFFLDDMIKNRYGKIVNIIGTSIYFPFEYLPYNSIKSTNWNLTKIIAKKLGRYNINVNNVLPGPTDTKELENIFKKMEDIDEYKKIRKLTKDKLLSNELINTRDISNGVIFLCSEYANRINGIDLTIDNGFTL